MCALKREQMAKRRRPTRREMLVRWGGSLLHCSQFHRTTKSVSWSRSSHSLRSHSRFSSARTPDIHTFLSRCNHLRCHRDLSCVAVGGVEKPRRRAMEAGTGHCAVCRCRASAACVQFAHGSAVGELLNTSVSLLAFNANARGLRPSNGRRRPHHALGIRAHPSRHDHPNRPDIHGPNSRGGPSSRAGPRRNSSRPNSRSSVTPMVPTTRASRSTDRRQGNTQVRRRRA
jgi:hypothetical protein